MAKRTKTLIQSRHLNLPRRIHSTQILERTMTIKERKRLERLRSLIRKSLSLVSDLVPIIKNEKSVFNIIILLLKTYILAKLH